jgi:hypothetical protein
MTKAKMYAEVYAVLCLLGDNYVRKIPQNVLDLIADARDKSLEIDLDPDQPLETQNLSAETVSFLAMLKLDYWCETAEEKAELMRLLEINECKKSDLPLSAEQKKYWLEHLRKTIRKK